MADLTIPPSDPPETDVSTPGTDSSETYERTATSDGERSAAALAAAAELEGLSETAQVVRQACVGAFHQAPACGGQASSVSS